MSHLRVYLRNHEAAAQAGRDLFHRVARTQRAQPWGQNLQEMAHAVEADLISLRHIMGEMAIPRDGAAGLVMRLGERLGRFKLNGRVLSRSPLSDVIEVEGLLDAVCAKRAGWHALQVAPRVPASVQPLVEDLRERADAQINELQNIHRRVAESVL